LPSKIFLFLNFSFNKKIIFRIDFNFILNLKIHFLFVNFIIILIIELNNFFSKQVFILNGPNSFLILILSLFLTLQNIIIEIDPNYKGLG
jgi:hypothetical protein